MADSDRPAFLILGATGGIGSELARELNQRNWNLLLVARGRDRLEKLASELEAQSVDTDATAFENVDAVAREAMERFGRLDGIANWGRRRCLPSFGPFVDAMSVRSSNLFHTRLSSLINLHRILPRDVVTGTPTLDLPIASKV